jgi:asparagine synthase (glutamine-hydrolysing)
MCGFAGVIDLSGQTSVDRNTLTKMTCKLDHRGPDSSGFLIDQGLALGFRRLSLIDLEGGDQPILNEDGSVALVCNGEIFNYREIKHRLLEKGHIFRTSTDVEVLLHLYEEHGVGFLNMLNGQFAFALYDKKERLLLLARDHFGICPLFYTMAGNLLIFASEIKAILEHPSVNREVDLAGLDQVLTFPGLVSPRTMFKGIRSLTNGHFLTAARGDITVSQYWDLDYPREGEIDYDKPESFYVDSLQGLLEESVKLRLHADVPVGLYISGGLDSSLIAAITHKLEPGKTVKSYSITFDDRELSEEKYQKMVARQIGSDHHEAHFDWSQISRRLKGAVYHSETPLKETYNTASMALSEAARANDTKAILTGEGADELFAGYVGYRFDQLRRGEPDGGDEFDLEAILEREMREEVWGDSKIFYEVDFGSLSGTRKALLSGAANESLGRSSWLRFGLLDKQMLSDRHFIHQRSYLDFKLRLYDHLISDHGDRMALANSVEARYPFLDINLVEFAKQIPPHLKLNGFTEKYILKQMARGLVAPEIVSREKYAFLAPGSPYLLCRNIDWIEDTLSYDLVKRQGYFNPDTVESLKQRYSQEGFKLNLPFESDLLVIVLTFGVFLEAFDMPGFN